MPPCGQRTILGAGSASVGCATRKPQDTSNRTLWDRTKDGLLDRALCDACGNHLPLRRLVAGTCGWHCQRLLYDLVKDQDGSPGTRVCRNCGKATPLAELVVNRGKPKNECKPCLNARTWERRKELRALAGRPVKTRKLKGGAAGYKRKSATTATLPTERSEGGHWENTVGLSV